MRGAFDESGDDGAVCEVATDARVRRAAAGMAVDTVARRVQRERTEAFIVCESECVGVCATKSRGVGSKQVPRSQ